MRTVRSAAEALQAASSLDALHPIAAALGCDGEPVTLAPETAAAVGLPDSFGPAQVARGPGSLRALLVVAPGCGRGTFRDAVDQLASRVATRAPHLLWIVAAVEPHGPRTAILTWSSHRSPPRVAALIVDRNRIVDSDAETLRALAAARGDIDVLVHARWLDILGRDALTRRFYRTLERLVGELAAAARGHASMDERRELALLHASRLLFLSFLEAKGWLDGDHAFLTNGYERCMAGSAANGDGFGYHRRVLRPLFFGTLNTPRSLRAPAARRFGRVPFLNGGLFATTSLERRRRDVIFPDAELGALYGDLLGRYRFTAREDSATWSEAAVDPEMLGRAFESLMASRERRTSGAFYTPHAIVAEVTHAGLTHALGSSPAERENAEAALRGEPLVATERDRLVQRLRELRVLDPACGSGAFLVQALDRLADRLCEIRTGGEEPSDLQIREARRDVVTHCIYGVDLNPMAVELCKFTLWLQCAHPELPLSYLEH
ncbi:MAG: DNA methyltransferase, partial [Gemmatimonadaceae bacterium]